MVQGEMDGASELRCKFLEAALRKCRGSRSLPASD